MSARAAAYAREANEIDASTARAIAAREAQPPRKMSAMESMSVRLGVSEQELQDSLVATVFSGCRSRAEFMALVIVANEYKLNPLTKEIYAFPAKGGGVVPMVSVDGWITLMNSHPMFDGIEFVYHPDQRGGIEAIEAVIYRKDRNHPTKVIEYLEECKRNTEPWKQSPRRMLRHRSLIQGVRVAFGFTGIYAPDDEDIVEAEYQVVPASATLPTNAEFDRAAAAKAAEPERDPQTGMTVVDEETARQLDEQPGYEPEGRSDEQHGDQFGDDGEDRPAWWPIVEALKAGLAEAKTLASVKTLDAEFVKIAGGLPDDVAADLQVLINAARARVR